jgi:hydrogenase maturation protein HypF
MLLKEISLPVHLKTKTLGLGSHTKNTVCFAEGKGAYISETHVDLGELKDFLRFEKIVKALGKKKPQRIAFDLHPEYQSSRYARQEFSRRGLFLYPVQHHHAHIASCMADNGLINQKVIGVAFDGTGLGTDNNLWGGEFLICDYKSFIRKAHLKEIPLLGGEKAILEPGRVALAWLSRIYGKKLFGLKIDFIRGINKEKWQVLEKLPALNINSPLSSSMGRLFDAAASLLFAKHKVAFEAELAIRLEQAGSRCEVEFNPYPFRIRKSGGQYIIDPSLLFKEVVRGLERGQAQEEIAHRFHQTVAEMIRKACFILRKDSGIKKVVLSGGVFQNNILRILSRDLLSQDGFEVFCHKRISANDSGLSLGQAMIANFRS